MLEPHHGMVQEPTGTKQEQQVAFPHGYRVEKATKENAHEGSVFRVYPRIRSNK